jgi:hypothetical protein
MLTPTKSLLFISFRKCTLRLFYDSALRRMCGRTRKEVIEITIKLNMEFLHNLGSSDITFVTKQGNVR